MAKNKSTVYLGYEDEEITEKHVQSLNSTVNKIGGNPDWPESAISIPSCPLCGLMRPLIAQIYAPLERSQFHRTLYIFACLNPLCSQKSKGWLCVRTQHLDHGANCQGKENELGATAVSKKRQENTNAIKRVTTKLNGGGGGGGGILGNGIQRPIWCSGSDNWDDDDDNDGPDSSLSRPKSDSTNRQTEEEQANDDEANGNVMMMIGNNCLDNNIKMDMNHSVEEEEEEEDDDSNSMENELIYNLQQMDMNPLAESDPNANGGAAAAAIILPMARSISMGQDGNYSCYGATATLCTDMEGFEEEIVLVEERPQKSGRDLMAMLKQPPGYSSTLINGLKKLTHIRIKPFFVSVEMENRSSFGRNDDSYHEKCPSLSIDHIRELYQDYKRRDELSPANNYSPPTTTTGQKKGGGGIVGVVASIEDQEMYENALPAHGDLMFHNFLRILQRNPGQIIRYSRDSLPLLFTPIEEVIPKCPNCNGDTICEIQLLPSLIPRLRLLQQGRQGSVVAPIEFGNVLVFTCLKSCWDTPDKMRYERVIVQIEK